MADSHKHQPGWLLRTYVTPRGNRMQIGHRNPPVMICKVCGKRIVQESCPTRLLAAGSMASIALLVICAWFALKTRQPLWFLPFFLTIVGVHYAVYKRTTFVLLKYQQRRRK